jgi:hypothetical protein
MRSVRQLSVVILGITCLVAGQALDTHAKPKQSTAFGCTIDDLQTNFAGSCIRQADQDIINGNSYIHVVICEAGQQKCCTVSSSGAILNCRKPAGSAIRPGLSAAPAVSTRGVEGADDLGEEEPVPPWLNEQWLKEHDSNK